jgi:acetyl/propionyl-CoA carboxylase alpha subunit/acetyl-CoA carboxylase carboxyltransferase component
VNDISRLAIIDRGEPVVRVLAAVGNLNRRGDVPSITSIVVTEQSSERAWFAREADELITPPPSPDEVDLSTHIEPGQVVAQVLGAKADTAWIGHTPCLDRAELVAQLEAAGVRVVGPTAQTIRDLADPARLAALGRESGLSPVPDHLTPADWRRIEIDVLADSAGTVWTLGLRDASIRRGPTPVLAEMPAPGVSDTTAGAMSHAVRRLVRAAAYRGAGVVELALAHDGESFWLVGVDTLARTEHALVEEITGASFIGLRLRLAAGDALPATPPTPNGHAVEVRLLAHDPGREYAASGGALEMLSLPVGTGVRVDSSIREGDLVDGRVEPLIATVTAWGRDREEALDRAHGALERTTVVLEIGMTNRTADLAVLERVAAAEQPFDAGWYDRTLAAGGFTSVADPLAVVAAAVEAYESDSTMVNAAFFASAARGRPERPERVGSLVQLSYRGHDYRLRVDRTGPRSYRVRGNATVDLIVDRLGDFERRIICNGHKHRLVAVEQGADFRLDLDGVGHTVSREDGVVVRTGWPALVSSLLVEPGQDVSAGQPVAVLESMKMVTTVTAPFDGTVTSLAVSNNTQIERGAPLMRIKAASHQHLDLGPGDGVGAEPESAVDFSALVTSDGNPEGKDATWVHAHLGDYLLGYDLDPESFKGLLKRQATLGATLPANDPELVGAENALLDLFSDLGALYRPRTEAENPDQMADDNTQEYFLSYLQWLDADQAGLPERYRKRLGAALARYGVAGLSRTKALEAATVWLYRAFARIPEIAPAIVAILNRRLTHHDELADMATLDARARLDRLVRATEGRQQNVSDLARDITFHFFEEPEMLAATAQMQDQVRADLAALRDLPSGPDREARIEALVAAPHPVRTDLLDAWLQTDADAAGTAYRDVVLEVYARRFYRIRDLQDFGTRSVGAFRIAHADYEHAGMPVRLVNSYLPLEQLPPFADALRGYLCDVPAGREVVVDLVVWQNGKLPDADALVEKVHGIIEHCDFGHALHRLDLTVTGQVGDASGRSTAHMTFRQGADGAFTEDRLYRNLHPMLAKRLDLWRLSNFTLERLPSTEDVYLFFGVAHENPKDRRLFAVAEVRDLVAVRDDQTGAQTYPRLGRIGLQALAAMRTALSHYPPRERPTANRLVLNVRPVWEIPADEWPALAANYLPLAKGAGLEKVVMHLRTPVPAEDGGTTLVEKVMTIDGIGRTGTTIRFGDPGANPIRPLTRYAQKVLTAERFGTPYPYEIIHMLTPAEGEPSPFPRGHFQELDLDADGETLIPVDRPPAGNTAHLVVGLLTTYTDLVPEGMTRLAMLSDPTQGLGNLAEPECRLINASLALAAERKIPVEWYACSSGALIAMDSGTENMDFIALTLRRIIEFTQAGHEINIVVTGINVGGQPYWNAEATMLMHTKGILIMTPASTMVLTGKQALDFSGAVSAEDNFGIGGYDRVMGLNGQGQYWAPSFQDACRLLLEHYNYTYVVPGERFPRRGLTSDPVERDVRESAHEQVPGTRFTTVAEVFDDGENSIVWDVAVGGIPVCMIGLSSRSLPRKGFVPADGPPAWTSGTLFPQASRKTARAINATTGNRPLVVMANLSGFDGSPESMRKWQLEYGAEIGRAITNFNGPIVFIVVSRYHGGAFVVFSKALTESMEIAAIEGSYASVIGGAPAAATVFARDVKIRTDKDPRVVEALAAAAAAKGPEAGRLRAKAAAVAAAVRSEKLGEVADEFDSIHTIERALAMGSVDRIITAEELRPYIIGALERGMAKFTTS